MFFCKAVLPFYIIHPIAHFREATYQPILAVTREAVFPYN